MFRSDRNSNQVVPANQPPHTQPPQAQYHQNAPQQGAPFQPPAQTSSAPHAVSESEALARDIKAGTLTSFVGADTVLTGEATFTGMLRIDGHMSGSVNSQNGTAIIGAGGQVDANLNVAVAIIYGTVNGDIAASKRIELGRTSRVVGNIQTPSLVMEQGAIFEGMCLMPQAAAADNRRAKKNQEKDSSLNEKVDDLSAAAEHQLVAQ
jgi:cytoskeletal protein CcmA (bactofilin family)